MNALRSAVDTMAGDEGWASIVTVGQHVTNSAKLSSKSYGYARWPDLIRATEYFEEKVGEGDHAHFRRKHAAKSG